MDLSVLNKLPWNLSFFTGPSVKVIESLPHNIIACVAENVFYNINLKELAC
jgi:hypothetical protein